MIKLAETRLVWCPKDFHERGILPGSMYATTREKDMERGSLAFWFGVGCSDYREADTRGKAFRILVECIQAHVRDGISWDEIFKNVFARIEELSCIFSLDTYYKIDKTLIPSDDQFEKTQKVREKLFIGHKV